MSNMTQEQEHRAFVRGQRIRTAVIYTLLTLWAFIVLFPFYWMVLTSIKSYSAYNAEYVPQLYTLAPTMQNYVDAFTAVPLARYFMNTVIFTSVTTALMLVVIVLAAFAFSRLDFAGRGLLFTAFLSLMMIPNELVIITNFVTITKPRSSTSTCSRRTSTRFPTTSTRLPRWTARATSSTS